MEKPDTLKAVEALFAALEAEHPHLRASLSHAPHDGVDLALEFEAQPGLAFPVVVHLQGDELCLGVGQAFWCEWFPCTEAAVVAEFAAVVRGVLSGELRLIESHRGGRTVKADLQRYERGAWKTLARWSKARFPSLARAEIRVLQNTPALRS